MTGRGPQEPVERHRAEEFLRRIDRVDFIEAFRQIGRLAHEIDGLADRALRRHGDEFGLHAPAGGAFGIEQAPLERDAIGGRQLLEDLGLLVLRQIFENVDGVVGIELARHLPRPSPRAIPRESPRAPCRRLRSAPRSRNPRPSSSMNFGRKSGSSASIRSPVSDSCRSRGERPQHGGAAALDRACDPRDEILADRAVRIAQRARRFGVGGGQLFLIEHAAGLWPDGMRCAVLTPCLLHRQSATGPALARN